LKFWASSLCLHRDHKGKSIDVSGSVLGEHWESVGIFATAGLSADVSAPQILRRGFAVVIRLILDILRTVQFLLRGVLLRRGYFCH